MTPPPPPGRRRSSVAPAPPCCPCHRTIREDIDKTRLKKQGVITTVKGEPAPPKTQAPVAGSDEGGPNVALLAGLAAGLALGVFLAVSSGS